MSIETAIYTFIFGKKVGVDDFGNTYYESKSFTNNKPKKRWVIYKNIAEPSKVPASWHGWLHYSFDNILENSHKWQIPHIPNLTGTKYAWLHENDILSSNKKEQNLYYQSWKPKNKR